MLRFIFRRLLSLLPVLFVVSVVIFSLIHLTPGDPARAILGQNATNEQVAALRESMGLDRPLVEQYLGWVGGVLTGDFGDSYFLRKSVTEAIGDNAVPTIQLAVIAIIVAIVLSVPFGTLAARFRGGRLDRSVMGFTLIGMTVPSFVLALALMVVFGLMLRWLPISGYVNPFEDFAGGIRTLIMPGIALGAITAALITRTTRAAVLDVLNADYIDAARSRGVAEGRLLFSHTLKNASLPVLTIIGLSLGGLVTGAAVTETIFNIPGLGQLLVTSIARRDYPVIQGVILFVTLIYLLTNLLIDLLYGIVDPRVRVGKA
ncbi:MULTISPECIES: ABC transporter permease [Agromyces]|jgi:peptide/nickel transport system permease protein|uniref:ABC transporter permease n=1 Tax=Agromyces mediolanus TaxID=41986 RepID=A0A918C9Q4_AGRME|nr:MULTISPECIES: ABC transporter permease [Agromyces]MCD1570432.1 ABC transporter permease [Agromyces mediolanus]MCM3657955.1 ABC transporter permease [Agromyces mediolanus]GGR13193.1 ABC transporter permease [Agromyces mediolanus]GLJ72620.1 ABC transporter permease [Agromyces mediolanus]GLU88782.1 ABC transporter permease [Agromyces sp. NBRC 114283]